MLVNVRYYPACFVGDLHIVSVYCIHLKHFFLYVIRTLVYRLMIYNIYMFFAWLNTFLETLINLKDKIKCTLATCTLRWMISCKNGISILQVKLESVYQSNTCSYFSLYLRDYTFLKMRTVISHHLKNSPLFRQEA